jgi:hypothetical protein
MTELERVAEKHKLPKSLIVDSGTVMSVAQIMDRREWPHIAKDFCRAEMTVTQIANKWGIPLEAIKKVRKNALEAMAARRAGQIEDMADQFFEAMDETIGVLRLGRDMAISKNDPNAIAKLGQAMTQRAKLMAEVSGLLRKNETNVTVNQAAPTTNVMVAVAFPRIAATSSEVIDRAKAIAQDTVVDAEVIDGD